jgi:hypothetical protein
MGGLLCAFARIAAKSKDRSCSEGEGRVEGVYQKGVYHKWLQERSPSARPIHFTMTVASFLKALGLDKPLDTKFLQFGAKLLREGGGRSPSPSSPL